MLFMLSGVQGQADNLEQNEFKCPCYASVSIAVWMIELEPSTVGTNH